MKIIDTRAGLEITKKGCVLTIGNFDGVHIGHQEILTAARRTATQRAAELVVMTFEPHPLSVLHPQTAPGILTPLVLKEHILAEFGVDCLFVVKSGPDLLGLSPADFVDRFVVKGIRPCTVVEGEDFNFGTGRSGNIRTLYNLGAEKGFEVILVDAKSARLSIGHSVRISSTIIRSILESGKVADAAVALGRPYRLIGRVVQGQGRGKQLGFPTANLEPAWQIVPAEAVYAGTVAIAESEKAVCAAKADRPSAFSIGRAETLGGGNPPVIEAHILAGEVENLSGKWMAMDFVKRIRGQIKFGTEKELSAQIAKDCQKAMSEVG